MRSMDRGTTGNIGEGDMEKIGDGKLVGKA